MGCKPCERKRRATAWGSGTARASSQTSPSETVEDPGPTKLRLPSGEVQEFPTRLAAHRAKIEAGGGELIR